MAITVQMRTEISQLYVALFGRAPDGEGLGFWVQLRDQGMSLADIANTMYATTPARTYYPSFLTNQEIISSFYSNVLGRSADAEGLAFWTNKLNAPGATPGSVIAEMIGIVANYTGTDAAGLESQALFNNRVEVAQYYAEKNGSIAGATTVLAGVTSDDATVAATKTQIDGGTTGGVNQGSTFTFTSAIDNFIGTAGNDKFIADNANVFNPAIQPGDTINGGSGVDIANLFLVGGTTSFNSTGVENFFVQSQGAASVFNAQNIAGAEQIWTANSTGALTVSNVQNNAIVGVRGGQTAGGAPVDALTVNFKSGVGGSANTLNVALEAGNVAALSVGDTAGLEDFGTISIGASQGASTIADVLDGAGNNSQTAKYVFTGDSRVTVNAELEFATTLDASGSTGGARVVIDDTLSVAFTGGAGADRVNVQAAGLTAGDKLDGGEGSDTFRIQSGTMLTAVNAGSVKNFEVVNVHADGAATTYDMDALVANNTLTGLMLTGTNAGATVNNMTAAQAGATTFAVNDEGSAYTLDVKSFVSGGTGDTASISLDNSVALDGAADGTGVNLGTLTFAKVDVLNIASKSDGTAAAGEFNSIASLSAGDLNKMVITGDQSIQLTTAVGTEVTEVDASGLVTAAGVGGATVNIANTAAGGQVLVTGSAAADVVTMSGNASLGDTLRLGAGSDTATLSANGARDTVEYLGAALGEGDVRAGNVDAYTNFENNVAAAIDPTDDIIKFSSGVNNALRVGGVNLGATTANVNVGAALSATSNVAAVTVGGDLQLQFDLNGDGAYSATADFAITLVGQAGAAVTYSAAGDFFAIN